MNIADSLDLSARARPHHPAIEDGDRIVSYAELSALTGRAQTALRAAGVGPGERVVVALPDSPEHVAVIFALARLGAVSLSL
ncbi:MAG: AMP-binding protein, partial [Alphaproteobacteria bacterium]|nr:AMP-binding protein [Alphaproteobacteria bacterium]